MTGRAALRVGVVVLAAGVLAGALSGWARPARADAGPWTWPLAGERSVARPFVPPAHRYAAGHRGADLPAAPGAPVRSAGAGRVSYAGVLAGRGVVVVVHGALRTTYEPVTAAVGVGDTVTAGAVLGALAAGHAGCPAAACLHWGLRRGDDYLDPVRLVDRGPVRLLPLGGGPAAERPGDRPAGGAALRAAGPHGTGGDRVGTAGAEVDASGTAGAGLGGGQVDGARVAAPAADPVGARAGQSLRAATSPAVGLVALALLLGALSVRRRPRRPPPDGPGVGGRSAPPPQERTAAVASPGEPLRVVDLARERVRQRAA